jgi:hypothetical protein
LPGGVDRSAWGVDVKADVLGGILGGEDKKLAAHQVGGAVVDTQTMGAISPGSFREQR